ncbi:unnamed protein product, partial [Prunus brigantina]
LFFSSSFLSSVLCGLFLLSLSLSLFSLLLLLLLFSPLCCRLFLPFFFSSLFFFSLIEIALCSLSAQRHHVCLSLSSQSKAGWSSFIHYDSGKENEITTIDNLLLFGTSIEAAWIKGKTKAELKMKRLQKIEMFFQLKPCRCNN